MFVWRNSDLPPDPEYPADLEKLGYFINDNDQIRQIANPEAEYQYKINRNDRFNVKQREAMNECIRNTVTERLLEAGLGIIRLPYRGIDPQRESLPNEAHVPILASPNLHQARRIIVVFGETTQDLGIWANRTISSEGINIGSAVNFVKAVRGDSNWAKTTDENGHRTDTALVLANTGQLIWHCAGSRAVTQVTWLANPRPAGNWGQASMSYRNKIPHNGIWMEHVAYVFEEVIWQNLDSSSRVDVIGISEGGLGVVKYMASRWYAWRHSISGIVLGDPIHLTGVELDTDTLRDPGSFAAFVSSRCIAYVLSNDKLGTLQSGFGSHGCNCYSAGESLNIECILPRAWPHMLSWLDKVYENPEYAEQIMIPGADVDEISQVMEGVTMSSGDDDQVSSEDAGGIATEEHEADVEEDGGLVKDVKPAEACPKQEDVNQEVESTDTEDEALAKVETEDAKRE